MGCAYFVLGEQGVPKDGAGLRLSLGVSGLTLHCRGEGLLWASSWSPEDRV